MDNETIKKLNQLFLLSAVITVEPHKRNVSIKRQFLQEMPVIQPKKRRK